MLAAFGVEARADDLERYRILQWRLHARDFALRDGVAETLGALRERGLHLGVVSNIDRDQLAHMGELAGLDRYFDSLLSSEEARSCKPDPAIFAEALSRADCEPEEALFVGDNLVQDIAGANRVGLRSVLIWNRDDTEPPAGEVVPDHVIRRIPEILDLLDALVSAPAGVCVKGP
jgi:putative hydrolase of the HAD superfamily